MLFLIFTGNTIYTRVVGSGKENVDEAMQKSFAMLEKRALHKLNVDMEQISEVEPIVIGGMGLSPDEISDGTATKHKLIAKFGKIFTKDLLKDTFGNRWSAKIFSCADYDICIYRLAVVSIQW